MIIEIQVVLKILIIISKLDVTLKIMALKKAWWLDKIIIKSYKAYWDIIKVDYLAMIIEAIKIYQFPLGIIQSFISLLFKKNA